MAIDLAYNRSYGKWFATPVLRVVRRYAMIGPGERIAVALSGGKDSAALLFILAYLQRHSHLRFELSAIHVRVGDYGTAVLAGYCSALGVPYLEQAIRPTRERLPEKACSVCARVKRGAMARRLAAEGIRTVAFGHHATDAAETLLMNLALHRTLSAFPPKVVFGDTPLTIIRPMVYLEERAVARLHRHAGLPVLGWKCPYAANNIRERFRTALADLERGVGAGSLALAAVAALEKGDPQWQPGRMEPRRRGKNG
jgi:tRNA 2-thiocytidine biosynthesis protein TtcA